MIFFKLRTLGRNIQGNYDTFLFPCKNEKKCVEIEMRQWMYWIFIQKNWSNYMGQKTFGAKKSVTDLYFVTVGRACSWSKSRLTCLRTKDKNVKPFKNSNLVENFLIHF
jgi:hypothetical protein